MDVPDTGARPGMRADGHSRIQRPAADDADRRPRAVCRGDCDGLYRAHHLQQREVYRGRVILRGVTLTTRRLFSKTKHTKYYDYDNKKR